MKLPMEAATRLGVSQRTADSPVEFKGPLFNLQPPSIEVAAPVVNVAAPTVNIEPPKVNVNVSPPKVDVNVAAPNVTVKAPELNIHALLHAPLLSEIAAALKTLKPEPKKRPRGMTMAVKRDHRGMVESASFTFNYD